MIVVKTKHKKHTCKNKLEPKPTGPRTSVITAHMSVHGYSCGKMTTSGDVLLNAHYVADLMKEDTV